MKSTIKKYICAALAAAAAITIICAGFTTAFAETSHKYISIEIDSETFRDFDKMFCYIYDLTDETEVAKWGSKNGAMTKDIDSDIWRFDLDEHEIELNRAQVHRCIFIRLEGANRGADNFFLRQRKGLHRGFLKHSDVEEL